jgi:quinolinate synthase
MATALAYDHFDTLSDDDCDARIRNAKAKLGRRVVILGHHYQRDEVFRHADFSGDSLKLSRLAAASDAEYIVFCGVHFMAEVADILSRPEQVSILPDLAAGCSMADMAPADELEICWSELEQLGLAARTVPVTYINSAAAIKSVVGERGGTVCTSSNAAAVLTWGWEQRERILFLPDQHLGRNTAFFRLGVPLEQMVVWDPKLPFGGLTRAQVEAATLILWKGHCSVHVRFTARQIAAVRAEHPGVRVIVHPEVPFEVVQAADDSGSTEYILTQVREGAPGSVWAVGTEVHLVHRLAAEMAPKGVTVLSLDQMGCLCSTMFRVSPNHLLWVLEGLVEGQVHNQVEVPEHRIHWSRVALDRMLQIH